MAQNRAWDTVPHPLIDLCNVLDGHIPRCNQVVNFAHVAQHKLGSNIGKCMTLGVVPSEAGLCEDPDESRVESSECVPGHVSERVGYCTKEERDQLLKMP